MTKRRRSRGIVVSGRHIDMFLAAGERMLIDAEQIAQTHGVLVIEPGDKDLWFIPQVYALNEGLASSEDAPQ